MITVWVFALVIGGKIIIVTDSPVERIFSTQETCLLELPMAVKIMEMPVVCVPQQRKVS